MITLALAQLDLTGSVQENMDKTALMLKKAQASGASLALLPELFPFSWFPVTEDSQFFSWAQSPTSDILIQARDWARQYRVTLVFPTYELAGTERFNTTFVISPNGDVLGHYRKNHIPYHPGWYEKFYYQPGNSGWPVFYHQGMTFGVQTCWDNLFPEGSRILGLKGVHLILAPRGTGDYSRPRWRTQLAANALANQCFVASTNRVGLEGTYRFGGDSFVVDPNGTITSASPNTEELLVVPLNLNLVYESRREWPFWQDRRPELYRALGE